MDAIEINKEQMLKTLIVFFMTCYILFIFKLLCTCCKGKEKRNYPESNQIHVEHVIDVERTVSNNISNCTIPLNNVLNNVQPAICNSPTFKTSSPVNDLPPFPPSYDEVMASLGPNMQVHNTTPTDKNVFLSYHYVSINQRTARNV